MFHSLLVSAKYWLLDYLHPPPDPMIVQLGTEGSLEHHLLMAVLKRMDEESMARFSVKLQQCSKVGVVNLECQGGEGWLPSVRYLATLMRWHPIDPWNALCVDHFLEKLAGIERLCRANREDVTDEVILPWLLLLEEEIGKTTTPYIGDFVAETLADMCSKEAIRWMIDKEIMVLDEDTFPGIAEWLTASPPV
jgi:hypothetical protein